MLPKERLNSAMNLQKTDRIPLMCQFSIGHMLLQLGVSPAEFWFDKNIYADGLLRLREIYDFDGILISLHGHDPRWRDNVNKIEITGEGEQVFWNNEEVTLCHYNDLPVHLKKDTLIQPDISDITQDNLPDTLDYIPVSQGLHFKIHPLHKFDIMNEVIERAGNKYSVHGEITSPFDYLLDLTGHQNALLNLIMEPEKCKSILQHFTKIIKELALEMCDTGIDAIKVSSPFAGSGFISPADYAEFVLPYEKEIAESVRKKNVHIYTHTCGAINDRLELMLDSGISGIECLDPPPLGNVELDDAFSRIKGKCFIKGNIDSINTLLAGSDEDILNDAETRIKIGKESGGFILSTACSIAPGVKREKILLLKKAVEKWG